MHACPQYCTAHLANCSLWVVAPSSIYAAGGCVSTCPLLHTLPPLTPAAPCCCLQTDGMFATGGMLGNAAGKFKTVRTGLGACEGRLCC